jgi:hypothetical protein
MRTRGSHEKTKVLVILSEAKDLQFRSALSQCRFFPFAPLRVRMTDFQENEATHLRLLAFAALTSDTALRSA